MTFGELSWMRHLAMTERRQRAPIVTAATCSDYLILNGQAEQGGLTIQFVLCGVPLKGIASHL